MLAKNCVPKQKFIKVDLPVDYGPITHTTMHFVHSISYPMISLIMSALISRFLPSINSNVSPSSICYLTAFLNKNLFALSVQKLHCFESTITQMRDLQKYSYERDRLNIISSKSLIFYLYSSLAFYISSFNYKPPF